MPNSKQFAPAVAEVDHGAGEVFSASPDKRAVEEAFVVRLASAAASSAARILSRANHQNYQADFTADMERLRHPVFSMLARELEKSVPADADFGPFPRRF